jgi:signal transduction histidine kinase
MSWWSSFTFRVVIASLAWTAVLLYVAHLGSVLIMFGPDAITQFGGRVGPTTILAAALMVAGALIVRRALATFGDLRRRLVDVQEGRDVSVTGTYLREVEPVVSALNALLEHQDRRVREAHAKAGDLAHGLKTPLAVLTHEAERAAAHGHHDLAATLTQQIDRMRRHIQYHLAHARAAASGATPGARCVLAEAVDGIVRTLQRLHAERGVSIEVHIPPDHIVRGQREDVEEMLGNLLDNACKWTRAHVVVTSARSDGRIAIAVDDDGPGIAPTMRAAVLQRGVRADEAAPGSGLGLAIAADLASLYGGAITLETSPRGGLRARLDLPQAAPVTVQRQFSSQDR